MQEFPPQSAHCRQSSHDGHQLRQTRKPQLALGEARIEDIKLDHKSRDDIPAVLLGLQHLYSHEETREKLFSLLEEHILPGTNRNVGRPGMELWRILVMGVLKQGLGCDFDRLHELVNQHRTVREFLGHGAFSQDDTYEFQTIIDNVYLLTPELLSQIGQLVVESGHAVARKKPGEPLRGRCDSFVVETDVHYPTDVNLLWDAMRCLLRELGHAARKQWHISRKRSGAGAPGADRQRDRFADSTRRAKSRRPDRVEAYIAGATWWRHLTQEVKRCFNKAPPMRRQVDARRAGERFSMSKPPAGVEGQGLALLALVRSVLRTAEKSCRSGR